MTGSWQGKPAVRVARAGQRSTFLWQARARRAFYVVCLRIAAKPTRAKRAESRIIAHPESVGTLRTVKVPLAATVLLPLVVRRALMGSVLTKGPSLVGITFTETVQQAEAGMIAPADKVTAVSPDAGRGVNTPPIQVVLALGVAAITTPSGRVSVSGAIRLAELLLGLHSVMVRVGSRC
jgi:hypothetical protein